MHATDLVGINGITRVLLVYSCQQAFTIVDAAFCIDMFRVILTTVVISLNNSNQLISVMVKCGVFFEVRTEFLNNI
jgi:hypothetical protein